MSMKLPEIIDQAHRFADVDKSLAYHYLIGLLERANDQDPNKVDKP